MSDLQLNSLIFDWCNIISCDHCKDRDFHFSIVKHFAYGTDIYYEINHYGYIINPDNEPELNTSYKTHQEARNALIELLNRNILKEINRRNKDGVIVD